jgi:hypothetical protein
MINCKNCNADVSGNYCSNCGLPLNVKRIDGHYIAHEIEHVLHFERGILYTIKGLLVSPGENVRHFISENRSRLVKPVIFIIVTSLVYSLINHFFHLEAGYINFEGDEKSTPSLIFTWIQDHLGYGNLIMGVFIAFWARIFFKKYNYNFFEILILLCFVTGISMLIFAIFGLLQGLTHVKLMQVGSSIGIAYCSWAIGQFFDKKKRINYVKAFVSYMLGMLTFSLSALLIGVLIDSVIKH